MSLYDRLLLADADDFLREEDDDAELIETPDEAAAALARQQHASAATNHHPDLLAAQAAHTAALTRLAGVRYGDPDADERLITQRHLQAVGARLRKAALAAYDAALTRPQTPAPLPMAA